MTSPEPSVGRGEAAGLCASCQEPLMGRYCHRCGERVLDPRDFTLRRYLAHAVEVVTHLDGKLWRTFRGLWRPGFLTAEHFRGRRTLYMRPFAVFFVANVAFFLLSAGSGPYKTPLRWHLGSRYTPPVETLHERIEPASAPADFAAALAVLRAGRRAPRAADSPTLTTVRRYERAFDARVDVLAKSLIVTMIPIAAAASAFLSFRWRRNQPFPKHLVFATHFFAAFLIFLLAAGAWTTAIIESVRLVHDPTFLAASADPIIIPILVIFLAGYSYRAFRELFGYGRLGGALRGLAFSALFLFALFPYRALLFFVAFYPT